MVERTVTEECQRVILASVKFTYRTSVINLKVVLYNFLSHLEYIISLYPFGDPMTQELFTLICKGGSCGSQGLSNLPMSTAEE